MPPSKPRRVPQYRYHKPSGCGVVRLNGRDYYLGRHGTNESIVAYDALIARWLAGGRKPLDDGTHEPTERSSDQVKTEASSSNPTIVQVIAKFYEYLEQTYPNHAERGSVPSSFKMPLSILRQQFGRERAADFGPKKLKVVRQVFIDRGWVRHKVNSHVNRVRRAFRWATSEELIPPSVYQALAAVENLKPGTAARESKKVEPVTRQHIEAAVSHLAPTLADMTRLLWILGCRPGELFQMRPLDIDRTGEVWIYRPRSHKTSGRGKSRFIAIGPSGQNILSRYLERNPDLHCFRPLEVETARRAKAHSERQVPLSCGNRPGKRSGPRQSPRRYRDHYTKDTYRRAIERACKKAGIPAWTPYQLRHTRATEVRARFGLDAVQTVLGHSNAKTSEIYAELDLSKAVTIAKEIG